MGTKLQNIFESHSAPSYIIAEIGVNFNGNVELARKMIDAARDAGADAVKFQTFTAESLVTQGTPKVRYQEETTNVAETHYEMIRKLEFKREDHKPIMDYCSKSGIEFISTPYDVDSAQFLKKLGVEVFKTASADLVDLPLQEYLAQNADYCLVSVGMATLGEVEDAVNLYRNYENENVVLLHCVANYPCSDESLNLRVLQTLKRTFGMHIGYSDHSIGTLAASLSAALGAQVFEKHFTIDRELPGPDHKASATPDEFKEMVQQIRRAELMLGSSVKTCQEEERQMSQVSRKSIVVKRELPSGTLIKREDLTTKRPGTGIPSSRFNEVIGKTTRFTLKRDHVLLFTDLA